MPIDQIQKGIEKNPHNIDEVPIQADDFDRSVVTPGEATFHRLENQPKDETRADNHVQGVQAGHGEIERDIQLGVSGETGILAEGFLKLGGTLRTFGVVRKIEIVTGNEVVLVLLAVLDELDSQEHAAEDQGGDQEAGDQTF